MRGVGFERRLWVRKGAKAGGGGGGGFEAGVHKGR